jgi:tRNA pseudouridine55 synthase
MSAHGHATERGIDGVLILAKPSGPTSHDMVGLVRHLSGTRRVGHGGTLDPFASGVLPVFLGLATRLVEYHMGDDKAYRATVCFGATSETDDRDGELVPSGRPGPTREAVEAALAGFRGSIEQRPPSYSAMKVNGRRAYQLARAGEAPVLALRTVTVHRLELVEWDGSDADRPMAVLEVECGAGTYIRSIARDLGEILGCGAYLGALVRTRSGPFGLAGAHDVDSVRAAATKGPASLAGLMLPIDAGLDAIPEVSLTAPEVTALSRGQQVKPAQRPHVEQGTQVRLLAEDRSLVGIASWKGGRLVPEKMFVGAPGATESSTAVAPDGDPASAAPKKEQRLRVVDPKNRMVLVPGMTALTLDLGRVYVAVGVFDGLHRGHLYLLRELRRAAQRAGARPLVITFDAHPEELIEGLAPPLLCDPDERLVRLQAAGVEVTVVQHFDHALRITPYDAFVAAIRERVDLAGFVMTPDAAFGFERGGTPETLTALGEKEGFTVTVVPSYLSGGEQVRSSEIRRRITAGDLVGARALLGRNHGFTGRTGEPVDGATRLTFDLPVCLPPDGEYRVLLGPAWQPGRRPEPAANPASVSIAAGGTTVASGDWQMTDRVRAVLLDNPKGSA